MSQTKLFTPQEATQTLPLVKRVVEDILSIGQRIRQRAAEDPEVSRLMDQLDGLFDELESVGCFYKDWNFSIGLVDFPSLIEGKEVFLCWKSDEPALKFYHDVDGGFDGRKPIPEE